jgi:hypothetical protein
MHRREGAVASACAMKDMCSRGTSASRMCGFRSWLKATMEAWRM